MPSITHKFMYLLNIFSLLSCAYATTPPNTVKTYQVLNVQTAVSNDTKCKDVFKSLQSLSKKPLSFQFSPSNTQDSFTLVNQTQQIQSHSYQIVQQEVNGTAVTRIGVGHFMLGTTPINYVISISGDTANPKFQYLYPMILSSNKGHCYFTALLQPDIATAAKFQANIRTGTVNAKTDLSN